MELSPDRQVSRPHVRRELRRGRQLGDRQHAVDQAVCRHGPDDAQPVCPELGDVRIQGGGEGYLVD